MLWLKVFHISLRQIVKLIYLLYVLMAALGGCGQAICKMKTTSKLSLLTPNINVWGNFKIKLANSKWIAKVYEKKLTSDPNWKLKDFKADVLEKYCLNVSLVQCYRAKKRELGEVEMSLNNY